MTTAKDGIYIERKRERRSGSFIVIVNSYEKKGSLIGKAKNISESGILISLSESQFSAKDEGKHIELILVASDGNTEKISGKIIHLNGGANIKNSHIGVAFSQELRDAAINAFCLADYEREVRAKQIHDAWETLHKLQECIDPEQDLCDLLQQTLTVVKKLKQIVKFSECHIWSYDAGHDQNEWLSGIGGDSALWKNSSWRFPRDNVRKLFVQDQRPLLSSDADFSNYDFPDSLSRWPFVWFFPLCCRRDYLGLIAFVFVDEIPKEHATNNKLWLCYALANNLAQALDRWELSQDALARKELMYAIPRLTSQNEERPLKLVYDYIFERVCKVVHRQNGLFRLYEVKTNQLTVCATHGISQQQIPIAALSYELEKAGYCKRPTIENSIGHCEGCIACKEVMRIANKDSALRITLWNAQKEFVGQICLFKDEYFKLTERLHRRLERLSSALIAVMEGAFWKVIGDTTHAILASQATLVTGETREFLNQLVCAVAKITGAEACSLFLADHTKKFVCLEATTKSHVSGEEWDRAIYEIRKDGNLTSRVAAEEEVIAIPDVLAWHRDNLIKACFSEFDEEGSFSFIGVPLFDGVGKLFGVLRCSNKRESSESQTKEEAIVKSAFHRHDIHLLLRLAEVVAPLANLATGDREINRRLVLQGHEVKSIAGLIISKSQRIHTRISSALDQNDESIAALDNLQNAGKLISMLTDDVSVSVFKGIGSWNPRICNLSKEIILEVVGMLRDKAFRKGLEIKLIDTKLSDTLVSIDPDRMKQVFYNLINNAIKYKEGSSITEFEGSQRRFGQESIISVRSFWRQKERALTVNVISHSCKITEQEAKYIFDYGYRGATAKRMGQGLGIGLFICRKIQEASGGLVKIMLSNKYAPVVFTVQISDSLLKKVPRGRF